MVFWSGYERSVRHGPLARIWVRRARCRRCRTSHALVPSFCLLDHLDVFEVIGTAIAAIAADGRGVRPVAAEADVPHTTARDWVRRFCRRADLLAAAFAAVVVELAGTAPSSPTAVDAAGHALAALGASFSAFLARAGPALRSLWRFAAAVTGGRLLATNTRLVCPPGGTITTSKLSVEPGQPQNATVLFSGEVMVAVEHTTLRGSMVAPPRLDRWW